MRSKAVNPDDLRLRIELINVATPCVEQRKTMELFDLLDILRLVDDEIHFIAITIADEMFLYG